MISYVRGGITYGSGILCLKYYPKSMGEYQWTDMNIENYRFEYYWDSRIAWIGISYLKMAKTLMVNECDW